MGNSRTLEEKIDNLQRGHIKNMHRLNDEWEKIALLNVGGTLLDQRRAIFEMHKKVENIINNEDGTTEINN